MQGPSNDPGGGVLTFMWGSRPKSGNKLVFHVEGDMGWVMVMVMVMVEKVDVRRAKTKGNKNGQKQQKSGGDRSGKERQQNFKPNKKPGWGQKGSGNAAQGKDLYKSMGESGSGSSL